MTQEHRPSNSANSHWWSDGRPRSTVKMADPPLVGLDPAFDGVLRRDPRDPTRCEYFQDRNKRWPFHCDDDGFESVSYTHLTLPTILRV